uniref:HMA domain-containing protein n=1 Tax=Aegilops tauschii TaxID=37682 RepID=R7VZY5_AEGTA
MGIVDVVSEYCSLPRSRRHMKRRKQFQTVEMKVRIDCEGCERKVKKALDDMKGVSSVEVIPKQNKVTVTGYVDPAKVMRRVAYKTGKRVEPWPYVPLEDEDGSVFLLRFGLCRKMPNFVWPVANSHSKFTGCPPFPLRRV